MTGGAGFIGSHIVDTLSLHNNVIVVDNLSSGRIGNINQKSKFLKLCIENKDKSLEKIFKEYKPEIIFHLAAIPGVNYSVLNPIDSHKTNVDGTLNLLELSAKYKVKRFIFSSSSSVYGDTDIIPTPETVPLNPKSPYALQKKIGEEYCKLFSELYGLDTVCLRYFNVMGPRQYGDSPYSSVVSLFANSIKNNTNPIIYGDGEQSRDFCPVENVVHANILAAQYSGKFSGDVFNIGCGQSISVNKLHKMMGAKEAIYMPGRAGDIKESLSDISKAKKILGYDIVMPFEEGLKNTLSWYLSI